LSEVGNQEAAAMKKFSTCGTIAATRHFDGTGATVHHAPKTDIEVDGSNHRDLVLQRRRRSITWPSSSKLPQFQRQRHEPRIRRAYAQQLDLVGANPEGSKTAS
jgi:hypothetical protein